MYVNHKVPKDARLDIDERNQRIKLVDCGRDPAKTVAAAVQLAESRGLEKIWGFISAAAWMQLARVGFVREGLLDGYFDDGPGIAVARYLAGSRAHSLHTEMEDGIVAQALEHADRALPVAPAGYELRMAVPDDAQAISQTLTGVFTSYPTPIDSAADIHTAMARDAQFAVLMHEGAVVGVASADVDCRHRVAEMTDCAVLPEHRGRGLMTVMLQYLAAEVRGFGLRSLFTLARATSVPINQTFARLGYAYRGRLINNCHIAGDWEDMNLWVQPAG
ncbi:MAG: putative beta-lysine N-acetyltransferase [Armatimonadota bacterium]